MGTRDLAERELIQGLIKLAAALVHQARGNPRGVDKNLRGARARIAAGAEAGPKLGIEVAALFDSIDAWLAAPTAVAILIPRVAAGPAAEGERSSSAT